MAESVGSEDTYLNSCPICLETFKTPRTLPCLHTFCQTCLSSYIISYLKQNKSAFRFECPVCRAATDVPSSVIAEKWMSGLQVTESMDGSELKLTDKLCEICSRKNEKVIAVSWCFECQEAICKDCVLNHRITRGLQHHQVKSLDKFKKEKVMHIPTVDIYCQKHKDRKLEIYCHDHKAVCCLACMTTYHRKCDQVTTVDKAVGQIKQAAKDEEVGGRIKQLSVQMRERADACDQNMEELSRQKEQIEKTISDEKRKLIQMFEELEKNDLGQLNKMHEETLQSLQERRVQYENGAKILEQCHASLDNNLKHFTDLQTCIELARIKRQLTEQETVADTVDQRYQYKFTVSPSISNMASIFTTYGDITRCSKIRPLVLANTFKVDLQSSAHFSDGDYFCNQKIILTVSGAPEVLVYDITGKRQSMIKLDQYGSWFGLTLVKHNLYAVSSYDSSCITFIDIVNQNVLKRMDIPNLRARRLASSKNKIIVASVSDVKILDYDGNHSKSLRSSSGEIFGVCVTKNDNILYTDRKTDELHGIDMDGKVLFTYSDKSLKCPTDVKADDDSNIYVLGRMSHNIHMLSPEGKFIKMFLSEKDGIHRPFFLSFNKDISQVMVCCDMDDKFSRNGGLYIKLFDMI